MTNPTLIGQETAWKGWTETELREAILRARGLTLDSTTGRPVASTDEQTAADKALQRAFDEACTRFPSVYSRRSYSVAWVANDHSIALPQNVGSVTSVTYGNRPIYPNTREDHQRLLRPDDDGGGLIVDAGDPLYYRITGFADGGSGLIWQQVLRLYPTPTDAQTLGVEYVALSPDLANPAYVVQLFPFLQGWLRDRAVEFICGDSNDMAGQKTAYTQREICERSIDKWLEGTREYPEKIRYRRPNHGTRRRHRF